MTRRCGIRILSVLALLSVALLTIGHGALACSACPGDLNGNGVVTIDEIVTVVSAALNGCPSDQSCPATAALLQTGQSDCDNGAGMLSACPGSPPGQDGSTQHGVARSYTDNGDGTITDNTTGLMWEKLSHDGSIHDLTGTYTWTTAFTMKVAMLNSGAGFAGHTDWRLPNITELQSIVDYGEYNPAIAPVFNADCASGCTVTTCSCTPNSDTWSSSSYQGPGDFAWYTYFGDGFANYKNKGSSVVVRAVRGGA